MQRLLKSILLLLFAVPGLALAQAPIEVTGVLTGEVTWTSSNTYVLVGRVFVDDGATLTIEPGAVIKGRFNADPNNAAALIVAKGGKIMAEGTASEPIIFTAEDDDVSVADDLTSSDRGLWGGVIVLGSARLNVAGGVEQIEGIPETEARGAYGGDNDADTSGVLRYVSIRHGGASIAPNNEINGLTLGGVGSGTVIDYVEVFANQDDCFEWFGGTVSARHLVGAFCGDDTFDYDEGFRGKGQFWFAIQADDDAGSGGEFDGGTTPEDGQPYAIPMLYNLTMIGSGAASSLGSNDYALNLRDNAGGKIYNSIFTDYFGRAVQVEDLASGEDSWARLQAGDLEITNNLFWDFGRGNVADSIFVVGGQKATSPQFVTYMTDQARGNQLVDPMLMSISRATDGQLDPRPSAGSPALTSAVAAYPAGDDFFTEVSYLGAFGPDGLWAADWTALSEYGILGMVNTAVEVIDDVPSSISLSGNYPNPFNPTTTIEFTLDRAQQVRLAVYDLTGREIAVLVDGMQQAGTFRATFEAAGLASGMYLYRLSTPTKVIGKKMMLLK